MPYDPEQAARQQAEQRAYERESAGRAKGATKSPLRSGGGGGFQAAGPTIKPGPDPTFDAPAGTSKGVIHSEAQEQSVRSKVAAGKPLTQEDL